MEQLSQEVLQRLWTREAAPDLHGIAQEYVRRVRSGLPSAEAHKGATTVLAGLTVVALLVVYVFYRLHRRIKGRS